MVYCKCRNCGVALEIDENDYMPGCREKEEVYCPNCKEVATTVFTSGIPKATQISKKAFDELCKSF